MQSLGGSPSVFQFTWIITDVVYNRREEIIDILEATRLLSHPRDLSVYRVSSKYCLLTFPNNNLQEEKVAAAMEDMESQGLASKVQWDTGNRRYWRGHLAFNGKKKTCALSSDMLGDRDGVQQVQAELSKRFGTLVYFDTIYVNGCAYALEDLPWDLLLMGAEYDIAGVIVPNSLILVCDDWLAGKAIDIPFDHATVINPGDIPGVESWLDTLIVLPRSAEEALTAVKNFIQRPGLTKYLFFVGQGQRMTGHWKFTQEGTPTYLDFSLLVEAFVRDAPETQDLVIFAESSHSHLLKKQAVATTGVLATQGVDRRIECNSND